MTHGRFVIGFLGAVALLVAAGASVLAQVVSARGVLERFCELDAQGEQLVPDGWQKVAALFLTPGAPRRDRIIVIRDFVASRPAFEKGGAEFYVEYIQLGQIDPSQGRFSILPTMKVRAAFHVINPSVPRSGAGVDQSAESDEWRIAGPVPDPHVTVDAAIRYATELRTKVTDPTTRRNADATLAALKRLGRR